MGDLIKSKGSCLESSSSNSVVSSTWLLLLPSSPWRVDPLLFSSFVNFQACFWFANSGIIRRLKNSKISSSVLLNLHCCSFSSIWKASPLVQSFAWVAFFDLTYNMEGTTVAVTTILNQLSDFSLQMATIWWATIKGPILWREKVLFVEPFATLAFCREQT